MSDDFSFGSGRGCARRYPLDMALKVDDVVAQLLALPPEDRAKVLARVQASLTTMRGETTPRLLDLAGTGTGLWGDSDQYLRALRDEWR